MSYKEFYIWLDGYLSAKLDTNKGNTHFEDIIPIVEKMKEVKDEKESLISEFINKRKSSIPQVLPIFPKKDEDDLGHPPKIVM